MRDLRCWQAEAHLHYQRPPPDVHALALQLAQGEVASERLWPQAEDSAAPGFHLDGIRSAFVEIVRNDSALHDAWTHYLEAKVRDLLSEVPSDASAAPFRRRISRDELDALLQQWSGGIDPTAVWHHPSRELDFFPDVAGFGDANLFLQINPVAACAVLEILGLPSFVLQGLQWGHPLSEDRELLLELLCVAPAAFDGERWTHRVVLLLAVELIVQHAVNLDHALQMLGYSSPWRVEMSEANELAHACAVERLRAHEIPAWLMLAFERVLSRGDGRQVLILFLSVLSRKTLHASGSGRQTWDANVVASELLAVALAKAAVTTTELRPAWLANEAVIKTPTRSSSTETFPVAEGARSLAGDGVPHLMAAMNVVAEDASSEEMDVLWSWFEELLCRRAPDIQRLENAVGADKVVRQLGVVLSRHSTPHVAFATSYRRLEPQRRRAERGHRYAEYQGTVESMLLLRVGLHGAENLARGDEGVAARDLFHDVYRYARRLWLTKGGGDHSEPEHLVAMCFAFVPALFGYAAHEILPGLVFPIARDPEVTLLAANHLRLNRMPVDAIVALFDRAGANLLELARDETEWWGRGEGRPSWFQDIQNLVRCLEPEASQRRHDAIASRARERSMAEELRGATMEEDWLSAEREIAVAELRS